MNLPDDFNPVFVKEFRQTLKGAQLWTITGLILSAELLCFTFIEEFDHGDLYVYVNIILPLTSLLFIPLLNRFANDWGRDTLGPERATALSGWTILRGKLYLVFALLFWGVLISLPYPVYVLHKLDFVQTEFCVYSGLVLFGLLLNFILWAMRIAISGRQNTKSTGHAGIAAAFMIIGTFFCTPQVSAVLMNIQDATSGLESTQETEFGFFVGLVLYFLAGMACYAILLTASGLAPFRSPFRQLPARLGGLLLFLVFAGLCIWEYGEIQERLAEINPEYPASDEAIIINLAVLIYCFLPFGLAFVYVSFQGILAALEPVKTWPRFEKDSPKDPLGRLGMIFFGSGAVRSWIYAAVLMAVLVITAHLFSKDFIAASNLAATCGENFAKLAEGLFIKGVINSGILFMSYVFIYCAIGTMIRAKLPVIRRPLVLTVGIVAFCCVTDVVFTLIVEHPMYLSPLGIFGVNIVTGNHAVLRYAIVAGVFSVAAIMLCQSVQTGKKKEIQE